MKRNDFVIYDGDWKDSISDEPPDGEYEYSITPYYLSGNNKFFGNEIKLPRVIIRHEKTQEKLPDIVFKDWYNQ